MQKRQRFTAEFKQEAVRLLKAADKPAAAIARELGIPRNRPINGRKTLRRRATRRLPAAAARRPAGTNWPCSSARTRV